MNAEEQIRQLKQIPPLTKEEKRKKLMTSIVLSLATLISVVFLMYAFTLKQEADDLRIEVDKQAEITNALYIEAQQLRKAALLAQQQATAAKAEADLQRALALQTLEDCKKGK